MNFFLFPWCISCLLKTKFLKYEKYSGPVSMLGLFCGIQYGLRILISKDVEREWWTRCITHVSLICQLVKSTIFTVHSRHLVGDKKSFAWNLLSSWFPLPDIPPCWLLSIGAKCIIARKQVPKVPSKINFGKWSESTIPDRSDRGASK